MMRANIQNLLGVVVGVLLMSLPAAAVPFSGGGFEAGGGIPDATGGGASAVNVTNSTFGPWSANSLGLTSVVDGDFFGATVAGAVNPPNDAFEGTQYVAFNGSGTGAGGNIAQTFDTVAGQGYTVSFAIAGGDFDGSSQRIAAQINGTGGVLGSSARNATNNAWTTHSFNFTADAASTTLTFTDALVSGGASADLLLDNVNVNVVAPGPSYSDTVLADNPFVYYRFEEAAGSTVAVDSAPIGGAQNGTYTGANVTLGGTETGAPGGLGNAGLFGSSDAFVDVPNLGGNHTQLTVELWMNADGLAASNCCSALFASDPFGSDASGQDFHFNITTDRRLEHAMGGNIAIRTDAGVIQDNTWYHIVSTLDATSGEVNFYVDGVLIGTGFHNPSGGIDLSDTGQITAWIGDAARNLPGHIDEFAFYDAVLSAEQVRAHYDAAFRVPAVPEPSSAGLLLLAGFALTRGRKRRA